MVTPRPLPKGGAYVKVPSWGDAAGEPEAAARVMAALITVGTPTVDLVRLEKSVSALRALGCDPVRILNEAAEGERMFRGSVPQSNKNDTDKKTRDAAIVRLFAENNDLPFRSPSGQDALFRSRNRTEKLSITWTFSDEMGAVIAGRHAVVKTWRVAQGKRAGVYWFETLQWLANEIEQIDKGLPKKLVWPEEIRAWQKKRKLPPWPWGEHVVDVLAHYRATVIGKTKPFQRMAAAVMARLDPTDERAAEQLVGQWKKAAERSKGTKR